MASLLFPRPPSVNVDANDNVKLKPSTTTSYSMRYVVKLATGLACPFCQIRLHPSNVTKGGGVTQLICDDGHVILTIEKN